MVVLQNCMDVVEGESGNCSGTGETCDDDGTEEVSITVEGALDIKEEFSIKFEDAVDIKDENPESITFQIIKTEQEVRLWGVCVCVLVVACVFRLFMASKRKLCNFT